MLTLHIGLPKTATTFLQYNVFQTLQGVEYIHNKQRSPLEKSLQRYFRASSLSPSFDLAAMVKDIPSGDVLISDENISMDSREVWRGEGATPERFAERLQAFEGLVGSNLRLIVGVRRQDQWLGSRYAQSSQFFPDFDQADFERRMESCCTDQGKGAICWLDYAEMYRLFSDVMDPNRILILPMESIQSDLDGTLKRLESFLGVSNLAQSIPEKVSKGRPVNSLSRGTDEWKRAKSNSVITMPAPIKERLLKRYEEVNRLFANQTGLDLKVHGYF